MKIYQFKSERKSLMDVVEMVKTIEKVAASQIHFLKVNVLGLENYVNQVEKSLARIIFLNPGITHPLTTKIYKGKKVVIFMGSEKGLVGDLYHKMASFLLGISKNYSSIYTLGKINEKYLHTSIKYENLNFEFSPIPTFEEVTESSKKLYYLYQKDKLSSVEIVYPRFNSITSQEPVLTTFIPFTNLPENPADQEQGLPIYDPSRKAVFDWLVKNYITIYLYKIVLESKLSEFSARTVNMEHASAQARQLIKIRTHLFAKERRKEVTQKQLESFIGHK